MVPPAVFKQYDKIVPSLIKLVWAFNQLLYISYLAILKKVTKHIILNIHRAYESDRTVQYVLCCVIYFPKPRLEVEVEVTSCFLTWILIDTGIPVV